MDNIITYAQKELSDFTQKEFNGVDSLILSCLSYINFPTNIEQVTSWEGVRIADLYLAEYFEEMFNKLWSEQESLQLFAADMCKSTLSVMLKLWDTRTSLIQQKKSSFVP